MRHLSDIVQYLIIMGLLFLLALAMTGCKTIQPVVLPNNHTAQSDSVRTEYIHDSVIVHHWHTEKQKGDTFYIHDSVDRWKEKLVYVHDSIFNNTTDTIYQPVEIEKPQSVFLRNSGIALWVILALLVAGVVIGIILKIKK